MKSTSPVFQTGAPDPGRTGVPVTRRRCQTREMPRISPCLWFDDDLEAAVAFYTGLFPDSSVGRVAHYPETGPGEAGALLSAEFTLSGEQFLGINGGPVHAGFTETISFSIDCADQAEVDRYWDALAEAGEEGPCGWVRDRFGLWWQVVPGRLFELLDDPDPAVAERVTAAMLQMTRLVVADLEAAARAG